MPAILERQHLEQELRALDSRISARELHLTTDESELHDYLDTHDVLGVYDSRAGATENDLLELREALRSYIRERGYDL